MEVGVHEAKTNFSRLLRRVAAGEDVVICRGGRPVAKLVAVGQQGEREFGHDEGAFAVPDDFDDALPDEVVEAFEA